MAADQTPEPAAPEAPAEAPIHTSEDHADPAMPEDWHDEIDHEGLDHSHDPTPVRDGEPEPIANEPTTAPVAEEDKAPEVVVDPPADEPDPVHVPAPEPGFQDTPNAPEPGPTSLDIHIEDHEVTVTGDATDPTPGEGISSEELDRLKKIISDEDARRSAAATAQPRPFEHLDMESLLVLANQVRAEIAHR